MYSFPLRVYERHGACLCPEMLGSSVMWWVYIFKITPIVRIMSIIVILNFAVDDDYIYFFSVQQCTVMKTILFYCRISFLWICCLCSTCCTETFQRKQEIPLLLSFLFFFFFFPSLLICLLPTVLSSWYPLGLTYSLPVKVAVIESRHGTTHCLNTVDHSRWSQETHPVEKNGPPSRPLCEKLLTPRQA